jgi:hypothetical protein
LHNEEFHALYLSSVLLKGDQSKRDEIARMGEATIPYTSVGHLIGRENLFFWVINLICHFKGRI